MPAKTKLLSVDCSLGAPELLFNKIEDDIVKAQVEKLHANMVKPTSTTAPATLPPTVATVKPAIQFDDFAKIDLRTALSSLLRKWQRPTNC